MNNWKLENKIENIFLSHTNTDIITGMMKIKDFWQLKEDIIDLIEGLLKRLSKEDEEYAQESEDLPTIDDFLNRNIK